MPFNAIIWIVLVLLAVIGLSAVIRGISHALLCSGLPQCCCFVAVLYGNEADATLRGAIEQAAYEHVYDKGCECRKIIAVDMGLEPNMRAVCEMICNDYNIMLCDEYSLKYELKTLCNNSKTD